jgi:hypothetical protein
LEESGKIRLKLQEVRHWLPEQERIRGIFKDAESIEMEAIKKPDISKVAGSNKTEFVIELWTEDYKLVKD